MKFSAMLRANKDESDDVRTARCETVLRLLGLQDQRNFTLAKDLGIGRLSGGQMRRVGIGVELVTSPAILLLDEPTSALDAVNTRIVVNILKMLAESGLCVVASIHQPRLSAYESFSKLLLLSKGELIYGGRCGLQDEAVSYFGELGFELPPRANPADFFVEICFGFVTSETVQYDQLVELWRTEYHAQNAHRQERLPDSSGGVEMDAFRDYLEEHEFYGTLDLDDVIPKAYELAKNGADANPTWAELHGVVASWMMPPPDQHGFLKQFYLCLTRFLIKRLRMRVSILSAHLTMVVLSTATGVVTGAQVEAQSITFMVIFIALYSTYTASLAIETVSQGSGNVLFAHEACGGVSQYAEVTARYVGDILTWWLLPLLFVLPCAYLSNWECNLTSVYGLLIVLWWAMAPVGYLFATALGQENCACVVAAMSLVLGVFLSTQMGPSLSQVPGLLALSPPRWAIEALLLLVSFSLPFSIERAKFEGQLIRTGLIPKPPQRILDGKQPGEALPLPDPETCLLDWDTCRKGEVMQYMLTVLAYEKYAVDIDTLGELSSVLKLCSQEMGNYKLITGDRGTYAPPFADANPYLVEALFAPIIPIDWWWPCIRNLFIIGLILRAVNLCWFVYKYDGLPRFIRTWMNKKQNAKDNPSTSSEQSTIVTSSSAQSSSADPAQPASTVQVEVTAVS